MSDDEKLVRIDGSGSGSGCGSSQNSISKLPASGSVINVQLNDTHCPLAQYPCTPFPSESAVLSDLRLFIAPSRVLVVQLAPVDVALPSQSLNARLITEKGVCEYRAGSINDVELSLDFCTNSLDKGVVLGTGSKIELYNYNAPSRLLEVHFELRN